MKKSFIKKKINIDKVFNHNNKKKRKIIRNFIPLYPNCNPNNEIYVRRLQEALNDERILNIGVTGPYGSGKSSVLLDLVKRLPDKNKYITVSLATFGIKGKNESKNSNITDNNGDGNRDIKDLEIGILQQIIYKVDPKKIPLSKIVRIKEERESLFRIILTAIIYILNASIFNETNLYCWNLLKSIPKIGTYFSSTIFSIILHVIMFIFIYKSLGVIFRKFNITSISFKGIDLVAESKTESILNKYVDEIIYILKKSKYNIIIFEDIDRFEEEEIFIKLRELNKIINDNDSISKNGKVRFIYAVRDNILISAEERTKFFDFIVPIIPIISNNNAQLKFIEILEKIDLKNIVSEEMIQEVSYFVNDMRIVINICNEFKVYYEKIYKTINNQSGRYSVDQLFAIIAYKNLNPEDFTNMQYDKGHINELIVNKKYILELLLKDLKEWETKKEKQIELFENNLEEIKEDILNRYDSKASALNQGYFVGNKFYENSEIFVEEASLEEIFKSGIKGDNEVRAKTVDKIYSKNTWKETYNKISKANNTEINKIDFQIEELKKRNILNEPLKKILEEDNDIFDRIFEKITFDKDDKNRLKNATKNLMLMKFVKNGYITEEYKYYINNIYIENMTIEEYNFIAGVKLGKEQDCSTLSLPNIRIVSSRLNESDFEKENILNFDLFKYLLEQEKNIVTELEKEYFERHRKLQSMILHIEKNIEKDGNFFFYCIDNIENKTSCLNYIIGYAIDLWGTISKLKKEKIDKYMEYIVEYGDDETFGALDVFSEFGYSISKMKNVNLLYIQKLYKNAKEFKVKFKDISGFDRDVMEFIINKNMYEINNININTILTNYYESQENEKINFNEMIFEKIISISNNVKNYVIENINEFLENVIIDSNKVLSEKELIKIVNSSPSYPNLEKIIRNLKNNTIKDITKISNVKYWRILLKNEKVTINIANILGFFNKYKFSIELERILEDENNIDLIAKSMKGYKRISLRNKGFEKLLENMIYSERISDHNIHKLLDLYMKNQKEKIELELKKVPQKIRIKELIEKDFIGFSIENYKLVKNTLKEFLFEFCENNIEDFIKEFHFLTVTKELIRKIINSEKIKEKDKKKILELSSRDILV